MNARFVIILVRSYLAGQHIAPNVIMPWPIEGTNLASCIHQDTSRENTTENPNRRGLRDQENGLSSQEKCEGGLVWACSGPQKSLMNPDISHSSNLYPPLSAGLLMPDSSRCPDGCHRSRPHMLTTLRGRKGTGGSYFQGFFIGKRKTLPKPLPVYLSPCVIIQSWMICCFQNYYW